MADVVLVICKAVPLSVPARVYFDLVFIPGNALAAAVTAEHLLPDFALLDFELFDHILMFDCFDAMITFITPFPPLAVSATAPLLLKIIAHQWRVAGAISCFENQEQQKAIPIYAIAEVGKKRMPKTQRAIGQLAVGSFFFVCRSCEYLKVLHTGGKEDKHYDADMYKVIQ